MIIHEVEQGSQKWLELRAMVPTASEFSKILTPTGKPSAQAKSIARLCAAGMLGIVEEDRVNTWAMERGKELESQARLYYAAQFGPVHKVGLITDDEIERATCGCSPDSLVGEDGVIEIKCNKLDIFLGILEKNEVPTEHLPQIQGALMITERKWCDFVAYHPGLPLFVKRVYPDLEYQAKLRAGIAEVIRQRNEFFQKYLSPGESQEVEEIEIPF